VIFPVNVPATRYSRDEIAVVSGATGSCVSLLPTTSRQSVVSYRTADAAREFFTESTGRWSKCTNHNVNIQLNGQTLPAWHSGDLTKTDTQLAMPYTRGTGDQTRSCQRVLSIAANLILDIQACKPQQQSAVTQAADVAAKIESKLPR
jgi:hypothetical protein